MIIFLKNLFLKNWGLKLLSLLLAIILWLTLFPEEKTFSEKTLSVPLELHNIPSQVELVQKPPATVDVKIRAPKRLISEIGPANIRAILDLQKADVQQTEYPLKTNMISLPQGAEVKDIYPFQVFLKLERTKEVMMKVEPKFIGELPDGYKLVKTEIIPPEVLIKGPESQIKSSYKVATTPVDISSLSEPTELEADLILPNPEFLRFASSDTKVTLRLLIQKEESIESQATAQKKVTQKKK